MESGNRSSQQSLTGHRNNGITNLKVLIDFEFRAALVDLIHVVVYQKHAATAIQIYTRYAAASKPFPRHMVLCSLAEWASTFS
jgi:hypothetical protein